VDSLRICLPQADHRRFLDRQSIGTMNMEGLLVLLFMPWDTQTRNHVGNLSHTHLKVTNY